MDQAAQIAVISADLNVDGVVVVVAIMQAAAPTDHPVTRVVVKIAQL